MLKAIKQIFFYEIKDELMEYEDEKNKVEALKNKEKEIDEGIKAAEKSLYELSLTMPIIPKRLTRGYSRLDKWIIKRKQYKVAKKTEEEAREKYEKEKKEYNENVEQWEEHIKEYEKTRKAIREEIHLLEEKMKEMEETGIKAKIEKIKKAKTLKELDLSFEEAKKILQANNIEIVLDESDKEITQNESSFDKPDDFILVHKTHYKPHNDLITPSRQTNSKTKYTLSFDDEEFTFEQSYGRNTVHFCQNGEVTSHMYGNFDGRKYAILMPVKNISNASKLVSFRPEDTFFDGNVDISSGYILCPKDEVEKIKSENPNSNVIGYEGKSVDGFAQSFLSLLGYKQENISEHSWCSDEDMKKHYSFLCTNYGLYTTHDCSYENYRDMLLQEFYCINGFVESLIEYRVTGKKYDLHKLTKALLTDNMPWRIESGMNKLEGRVCRPRTPSLCQLLDSSYYLYGSPKELYLKDIVEDETFDDNSNDVKESNTNFILHKLEKEFNIKFSAEVKDMLSYTGDDKNIEEFIEMIQNKDKSFLIEMREEGQIHNVNHAKDIIFIKTIIDQVYGELKLERKVSESTKEIKETEVASFLVTNVEPKNENRRGDGNGMDR